MLPARNPRNRLRSVAPLFFTLLLFAASSTLPPRPVISATAPSGPHMIQSTALSPAVFFVNSSGVYWGSPLMGMKLPTFSAAVATSNCAVAASASLSHNSTAYIWSYSGASACGGEALAVSMKVYVVNSSTSPNREVIATGTITRAGGAPLSPSVGFPLVLPPGSATGALEVNASGTSFGWAALSGNSPAFDTASETLTVSAAASTAQIVSFTFDPTMGQSAQNSSFCANASSCSVSYSSSVSANNLLVIGVGTDANSASDTFSVSSDTLSLSWTEAAPKCLASVIYQCTVYFYASVGATGGAETVTISASANQGAWLLIDAEEWSGLGTVSTLAVATGTGTSTSSTTLTVSSMSFTGSTYVAWGLGAIYYGSSPTFNDGTYYVIDKNAIDGTHVRAAMEYSTTVPSPTVSTLYTSGTTFDQGVESGLVLYIPLTVTLPIDCALAESGAPSSSSFATSGGSPTPSPSTITCSSSGSTTNVAVQPSTTITVTVPSDGSNTRYRFSGGTAVSTTSCATGTCSTWSITEYSQSAEQFAYSITG